MSLYFFDFIKTCVYLHMKCSLLILHLSYLNFGGGVVVVMVLKGDLRRAVVGGGGEEGVYSVGVDCQVSHAKFLK